MTVHELAPAKINLGLSIQGKRDDGYHDILSIFQTVGICDELVLSDEGDPGLSCDAPDVPTGQENLVLKTARLIADAAGIDCPLRFTLKKHIPVGAGLGGGSSDAAAVLRGLKRLYGPGTVSDSVTAKCAERLGSDVPFLLSGGTAVVSGRGERIEPVAWPFDFIYVIVYPGFGVSTGWAYGRVREYSPGGSPYGEMLRDFQAGNARKEAVLAVLGNDFERIIFPEYPILRSVRDGLIEGGADAAFLTGSGSSLAGVFDDGDLARRCAEEFQTRGFQSWAVRKTERV